VGVVAVVGVFSEAGGTGIIPFIVPREVIKSKMGCCDVVAMVGVEYGEIISYIYIYRIVINATYKPPCINKTPRETPRTRIRDMGFV
jgi:hypothetical protein